ncbi:MAG TPA: hypothetical protein DCS07_11455 [Bdellovibrionales bacterium]|nr:MAG: hypothetical protein A2Z97_10805 [Bdellovibrionales bacterium GWB1_52_6]OFZ03383.1 MAG: hypothetical protein A2X97_05410 [Bdellovibrionales bacterium GWA1_52_35]OFZ40280.1 MAG: hypothetical protein A2070_07000 [Bdellovibrionales bacterium GWC1_52_8]HAR43225.1 hypothetical protein [Bdellovibrionales bacterium]HCM40966.1 hypothetical protein [Bdellovibrionales bacterium]
MKTLAIAKIPVSERPRERCLESGPGHLSFRECLAVILGTGPQKHGCLGLSEIILSQPGKGFSTAEQERAFFTAMEAGGGNLSSIEGLGPAGRARLLASFEMARRYAAFRIKKTPKLTLIGTEYSYPPPLSTLALDKIGDFLRSSAFEWLGFVPLHRTGELGDFCLVEKGARTHVNTDPVELFARVLAVRPKGFFLFHNHPSGDTTPSTHDRSLTQETSRLGREFGIRLLGHWIVAYDSQAFLQ